MSCFFIVVSFSCHLLSLAPLQLKVNRQELDWEKNSRASDASYYADRIEQLEKIIKIVDEDLRRTIEEVITISCYPVMLTCMYTHTNTCTHAHTHKHLHIYNIIEVNLPQFFFKEYSGLTRLAD